MNQQTDPWETEMSREFDQRVRDLHEAPLTLDHVKGKAGRIRRTRRIAAAGGVLAAAAVIVPVMVFAGGNLTDDSGPDPAPKPTPNPTAIDPSGPGYGYIEGTTVHLPDGSERTLPERYRGAAVLGDTIFAVRSDDNTGQLHLDVVGEDASPTETIEIQSGPVMNDADTMVAYIETDGDLVSRTEDTQTTVATGLGPNAFLTAVTGGPDCTAGACGFYVDDDSAGEPRVFDENGDATISVPDGIGVQDADAAGLVTVQNSSLQAGSCGGVYDTAAGAYLWETCDYFLFSLSPDSRHVDATHAYLDGFGNGYAAILDVATQQEVARLDAPDGGAVVDTAWQDAEHLLAIVYEPRGWSLYRLGLDGAEERVAGPTKEGDESSPWYAFVDGS